MNRADYLTQPFEVSIETLALCNARCTFCPYPTLERKGARMETGMVERLIMEMADFQAPFFFSPFKVNEPLLDPRFIEFCRLFESMTLIGRLRIFTNGSPLTLNKILEIADLKRVEHVWISLNSHDEKEYQSIMGLDFSQTCRRLDYLHAAIRGGFPHQVVVSKVVENDSQKNHDFVIFCAERWPHFTIRLIKRDGWLGYVEPSNKLVPQKECSRWFELSVMATGKVALCCMDGAGEYAIGDVNQNTLLDIYNAPHWRERREWGVKRQAYSPCNRCTY